MSCCCLHTRIPVAQVDLAHGQTSMEIRAKLNARPLREAACLAGGWVPSMAPQLGELLLLLLVLFLMVATLSHLTQRRPRGHSHGHSRGQAQGQSHARASRVGLRLLLAAALLGGLAVSSAIHSIRPARDGMPVGESGKVCAPHTNRHTSCILGRCVRHTRADKHHAWARLLPCAPSSPCKLG